jgi:hypothetical protein
VFALPFAYFMVVEWWALVSLGGWGAYLIVAWGAFWVLLFLKHLFGE